jgi:hypothetical protein
MDEVDQPEVLDFLGVFFLVQKNHVSLVKEVEATSVQGSDGSQNLKHITFDYRPHSLKETTSEAVQPRGLV